MSTQPGRRHIAGLRAAPTAYSDSKVMVDAASAVIMNVALLTIGPTLGHGFDIDSVTVDQLVNLAAQQPDGVKCRFKHPEITEQAGPDGKVVQTVGDDSGSMVGRVKNVRRDGGQARGDIYLGSYAQVIPGMGNVSEYLLRHAADDPAGIGMSAMFEFDVDPVVDNYGNVLSLPARLTTLYAIDFVGSPAANPAGLLHAIAPAAPTSGWQDSTPKAPAKAPTPVDAHDVRGDYLHAIVKHGPLTLGGLAARFNHNLTSMKAGADWLVENKLAEVVPGKHRAYKATPAGVTQAAASWKL